jgi:hypothetical protein
MRDDRGLYGIGSGGGLALGALVALGGDTKTHAKACKCCKERLSMLRYNITSGVVELPISEHSLQNKEGQMIDIYWQLQWYLLDLEFYKFILEHLIKWGL